MKTRLAAGTGILLSGMMLAPAVQAQPQPSGTIFEFGDSFQDVGYNCTGFRTPLQACSNYRNVPLQLGGLSAYRYVQANNFAVAGTASGPGALPNMGQPVYPGYPTTYPNMFGQIAAFAALGRRIGPNDLTMLSYAGNDLQYGNAGAGLAGTVVGYLKSNVQSLMGLGARNFVLFGGLPNERLVINGRPATELSGVTAAASREYYTTLNAQLPQALASLESTDTHIRILDVNTLYNRVLDTPAMYGFIAGDCATTPGCVTAPQAVQDRYAIYNAHPTDAFSLIIARYINNLLIAPYTVAAQADIAQKTTMAFQDSIQWQLNTERLRVLGPQGAGQGPDVGRFSVYASGNYIGGSRRDSTGAYGGDWHGGGASVGGQIWVTPNALLGLAFNYSGPDTTLNTGASKIDLKSYKLSGYASLSYPNWFADGVLSGGWNNYDVRREGVIDTLTASPNGTSFAARVRGGYLFDLQSVQVGPIAGLSYTQTSVRSYDEAGDIVLAQSVGSQRVEQVTGSAGLQVRYVTDVAGHRVASFADLTANRDFLDGQRVITTTGRDPVSAVPIYTSLNGTRSTFGRIAVGGEVALRDNVALGLVAGSSFARNSENTRQVNLTLKAAF